MVDHHTQEKNITIDLSGDSYFLHVDRVLVFNPFPQEAEHSPHLLHFVYLPNFPSTIP
jgi:hypothetical protein